MTQPPRFPRYPRFINEQQTGWLEEAREEPIVIKHVCGHCRTPWGRSALTCPNDPGAPR